jgi:hypothetical protein
MSALHFCKHLLSCNRNRRILFAMMCFMAVCLSGCAYQPEPYGDDLPGFWSGLLHGFLIVFSFIGSLFTHVRIYDFPNSGRWYDFGFLLGAAIFLGGAGSEA